MSNRLLITSLSADPMVFVKSINVVIPNFLVILETSFAKKKGWESIISKYLDLRKGYFKDLKVKTHFINEDDIDIDEFVNSINSIIERSSEQIEGLKEVYLDITSGKSFLTHIFAMVIREWCVKNRIIFKTVYIDPDLFEGKIVEYGESRVLFEKKPLKLVFDDFLKERFSIFNLKVSGEYLMYDEGNISFDPISKKFKNSFEMRVAKDTIKAIKDNPILKKHVYRVYNNLSLNRGNGVVVLEMDTVVIFYSGDVVHFEAKSGASYVGLKDVLARIKNFRDYVGGKSDFYICFPISSYRIESLKIDNRSDNLTESEKSYKKFINSFSFHNDIKYISLDEITNILKRKVERLS